MRKAAVFLAPLVATGLMFACTAEVRRGSSFATDTDAEAGTGMDPNFKVVDAGLLDGQGCSSSQTTIARTPVVLEFVVDESGSMQQSGKPDKWTPQRDALLAAFAEMKATGDVATYVGVQLFGSSPSTSVLPKPLTSQVDYDALVALIDKPKPGGGGTGTEAALKVGYSVVEKFKPPTSAALDTAAMKRIVILMSDGVPTGKVAEQEKCKTLAGDKFALTPPQGPILTFSIGVGPNAAEADVYDPVFMSQLAQAGGTAPAGCDPLATDPAAFCHFQVTPDADVQATKDAFLKAINEIRALSASCEFAFSVTGDADLSKIKVTITDKDGKVVGVPRDPTDGWSFDDVAKPTKVILNGNACSASSGTVAGRVDVVLGCKGAN